MCLDISTDIRIHTMQPNSFTPAKKSESGKHAGKRLTNQSSFGELEGWRRPFLSGLRYLLY